MSECEDMYLVSIANLKEVIPSRPVPLKNLARQLNVQPVSANQMIRKLENAGMVTYTPYEGVELTDRGLHHAAHILRLRRLWEVFLVEKLSLSPKEADELACSLEHITPVETAERLADYLGRPQRTPSGKTIPPSEGSAWVKPGTTLIELSAGESGQVIRIEGDPQVRTYLASEGIQAGEAFAVWGKGEAEAILICNARCKLVQLSKQLAGMVFVKKEE